jgi:hypothetical protein
MSKGKRMRTGGSIALALSLLGPLVVAAADSSSKEEANTRYGLVEVVPLPLHGDNNPEHEIRFNGRLLQKMEALLVRLHRVEPGARPEYVIVSERIAGLHCTERYSILEIQPSGTTRLSPVFGLCFDLKRVTHVPNGIRLTLMTSGSPASQSETQQVTWANGRLARIPAGKP